MLIKDSEIYKLGRIENLFTINDWNDVVLTDYMYGSVQGTGLDIRVLNCVQTDLPAGETCAS